MIIIGLEDCDACHAYRDLHPDYEFVELKKNKEQDVELRACEIREIIFKLGFDGKFPALLNDSMTELTPRSVLIKELQSKQ